MSKVNLVASKDEEGGGIHITGFKDQSIDSLYLTTSKADHDEMTEESTAGSYGVIVDKVTGTKVYWSFGVM